MTTEEINKGWQAFELDFIENEQIDEKAFFTKLEQFIDLLIEELDYEKVENNVRVRVSRAKCCIDSKKKDLSMKQEKLEEVNPTKGSYHENEKKRIEEKIEKINKNIEKWTRFLELLERIRSRKFDLI